VGRETQRVLQAETALVSVLASWAPVQRDQLATLFASALSGVRHHLRHRHTRLPRDEPAAYGGGKVANRESRFGTARQETVLE
jgi:hypothetical protein